MDKSVLFLSHYTKDTPYEEEAHKRIIPSLKKFDLFYEVVATQHRGSWRKNANIKSELIYEYLQKYNKILWTDCDSEICKFPELIFNIKEDIAIHELDWDIHYKNNSGVKEILGGTVYVTKNAMGAVKFWKDNASLFPREPHALQHYIRENKIPYLNLPVEYCAIINREGILPDYIGEPVIKHYQLSRTARKKMGG